MDKVYLDWASTAKPNEGENLKALELAQDFFGNPSSKHALGKSARLALEGAREKIAKLLLVKPETIFFTSGGTESNHIALLANLLKPNYEQQNIIVSAIEHSAISEQLSVLEALGLEVRRVLPNKAGLIEPESLVKLIDEKTIFVSVMAVNNEVGTVQPLSEIAKGIRAAEKRKIHFHTDAVQGIGKIPFAGELLDCVDSFSLSAHKLGGMRGVGLVYLKRSTNVFARGGKQESGIRPGTENLAGVFSLQFALEKYLENASQYFENAQHQEKTLIEFLTRAHGFRLIPHTRHPNSPNFSPYIIQAAHEKIPGEVMVRSLSDLGVFVSTGSACTSGKLNRPVLEAMALDRKYQQNGFRLSTGPETTVAEIAYCLQALEQVSASFG